MNVITKNDIENLIKLISESFAISADDRILIAPGLKIRHPVSNLNYEVTEVMPGEKGILVRCVNGAGDEIVITGKDLQDYRSP